MMSFSTWSQMSRPSTAQSDFARAVQLPLHTRSQHRAVALVFCAIVFLSALSSVPAAADGARHYKSGPIQITADGATVWVANRDHDSVSRITVATDAVAEYTLPAGCTKPLGLAVLDDGSEVWVTCHDSDLVVVLDGSGSVLTSIPLPWGTGPWSVVLSPPSSGTQATAAVTGYRAGSLVVIDVATRQIRSVEPTYKTPMGLAFVEEPGLAAWVTHLVADGEHNRLSRLDLADATDPKVTTLVRVTPVQPQNSSATSPRPAEGGYVSARGHPAPVPCPTPGSCTDEDRIWVPSSYQNIHNDTPSDEAAIQAVIRKVDLDARDLVRGNNFQTDPAKIILSALHVHNPVNPAQYDGAGWDAGVSGAIDVVFEDDGSMAYVLFEQSEDVLFLPTDTPPARPGGAANLLEIETGRRPTGLVASPIADLLFVYNSYSRNVSVLDTAAQTKLRDISIHPTVAEPFSTDFLRGAIVFHSSNEDAISLNRKVGCASCHMNAEADGRGWDFQHLPGTHGPRSTPSLLSLSRTFGPVDGSTGFGQLHRSGDRDEVQDFEHTFQGVQMGGDGFLGNLVHTELGTSNAGLSADLDDLADYLLGLEPPPRSPYRAPGGGLTPAAVRGATFFKGADTSNAATPADAGCATCHVPSTGFVDLRFHDVGQAVRPGEAELQNRAPANHVNTLTLYSLWDSAPFEGIVTWAEDLWGALLDFRDEPRRAPHGDLSGLTGRQMQDLHDFLLSIDGDMTGAEVTNAVDDAPPQIDRITLTSPGRLEVFFDEGVTEASVETLAAWQLRDTQAGSLVPITGATWDAQHGDRVTLTFADQSVSCGASPRYELEPLGPFTDLADTATGGTANSASGLPSVGFDVPAQIEITLGESGYENLTVDVHDAATIPGLNTWSHGSIWLFPEGSTENTGFVRFEWQSAFTAATGVSSSSDLVAAAIDFEPTVGDAQPIEARRVLQIWNDAGYSDFTNGSHGGPTWFASRHGTQNWNSPNARATTPGVDGDAAGDYFGSSDLAHVVDATMTMDALNERQILGGDGIRDAYRFWLDNPGRDYGHALRILNASDQQVRFESAEAAFHLHGPRLRLTYSIGTCDELFADGFESGDTARWN